MADAWGGAWAVAWAESWGTSVQVGPDDTYVFQGPKVTYTGPGPRRTAPTLAIKLYTPAYRHTHGRGY